MTDSTVSQHPHDPAPPPRTPDRPFDPEGRRHADSDRNSWVLSPSSALPRPHRRTRRRVLADQLLRAHYTQDQRLIILDTWQRSRLPARDFAALVGVSVHTLYKWRRRFQEEGPAGLADRPRGPGSGSRLPDTTRRAILMLMEGHPDWGQDRVHAVLLRSEGALVSRIVDAFRSTTIPCQYTSRPTSCGSFGIQNV